MFNHIKHDIARPFVKMLDTEKGHYYETNNGKIYPSITTMIHAFPNPGIERWKSTTPNWKEIGDSSMAVGTMMHEIAESYLNNQKTVKTLADDKYEKDPWELFEVLKPHLDEHINNIHATETKLYSDTLELAGTVDLVAEYDGELSIIDFKNSRKPKVPSYIKQAKYYEQGSAYSQMWKECTGMEVKQVVIIVVSWDNKVRAFKVNAEEYMSSLWDMIIKFEYIKP